MRNLISPQNDSFPVFEAAVNRKDPGDSKTALLAAFLTMKIRFEEYDQLYIANKLEKITKKTDHDTIAQELIDMYSYDNAAVKKLRRQLEHSQDRSIAYTCQYCSLDSTEEMDHYIGLQEFPEFSIHIKNLIPICSRCNRIKGDRWRTGTVKQFINLYLDTLPQTKFLFLRINTDIFGDFDFEFELAAQPSAISDGLWVIIKNHYKKLELFQRMKREALSYFSEFQSRVRNEVAAGMSETDVKSVVNNTANDNRRYYGANYWKAVFEEGLINSHVFWVNLNKA